MRALIIALSIGLMVAMFGKAEAATPRARQAKAKTAAKSTALKRTVASKTSKKTSTKRKSSTASVKKTQAKSVAANARNKAPSDLKTEHDFSDALLQGQYQIPAEGLAKVENEKVLHDVLKARRHFKDRLLKASEQE